MPNNALFYLTSNDMPLVSHADGIYIWDTTGRRYIDACSGAITCNIGHNHPTVKRAMTEQLDKVAFSYRTQFESQVALDLANKMVDLTDGDLEKVFLLAVVPRRSKARSNWRFNILLPKSSQKGAGLYRCALRITAALWVPWG